MKDIDVFLDECCDCGASCAGADFATPLNTMGMGGVDPLGADIIPVKKRKKMKSLKQRLLKKFSKRNTDDINWKTQYRNC